MVSSTGRPASVSDGDAVQVTAARRAGTAGPPGRRSARRPTGRRPPGPSPIRWSGRRRPRPPWPPRCRPPGRTTPAGGPGCRTRRPSGSRSGPTAPCRGREPPRRRGPGHQGHQADDRRRRQPRRGRTAARASTTPHTPATIPPMVALTVRHPGRPAAGTAGAHVGGTGISVMMRLTRAGPSPPLPSAISRWERHATATAWTSCGVT